MADVRAKRGGFKAALLFTGVFAAGAVAGLLAVWGSGRLAAPPTDAGWMRPTKVVPIGFDRVKIVGFSPDGGRLFFAGDVPNDHVLVDIATGKAIAYHVHGILRQLKDDAGRACFNWEWEARRRQEAAQDLAMLLAAGPPAFRAPIPGLHQIERFLPGTRAVTTFSLPEGSKQWSVVAPLDTSRFLPAVRKDMGQAPFGIVQLAQAYAGWQPSPEEIEQGARPFEAKAMHVLERHLTPDGQENAGREAPGAYHGFTQVAFSPDATMAVAAGHQQALGVYRGRDSLLTGKPAVLLERSKAGGWLSVSQTLAAGALNGFREKTGVWDLKTGRLLLALSPGPVQMLNGAISTDGRRLVATTPLGLIHVWNTDTGAEERRMDAGGLAGSMLALSADGRRALTMGRDRPLAVWRLPRGERLATLDTRWGDAVSSIALSPDGRRAAALSGMTVLLWDLEQE